MIDNYLDRRSLFLRGLALRSRVLGVGSRLAEEGQNLEIAFRFIKGLLNQFGGFLLFYFPRKKTKDFKF